MYDTIFDSSTSPFPRRDRRLLWALRIGALLAVVLAGSADAQLPGAPVLQNVWASPGLVGAVDFGGGSDGSVYAAAIGWTPGSGRFQLNGGIGGQSRSGAGSRGVYGVRVAMPFGGASSSFGFAAFAGIGGGTGTTKKDSSATAKKVDSVASTTQIPLGAAVGWRHAFGGSRGLSVYATPAYVLYSGGSKSGGLLRVGIGADVGITSSLGATVGFDLGGSRPRGYGGPSGSQYGIGVSYAFGRR